MQSTQNTLDKIRRSGLPKRFCDKLVSDLNYLWAYGIPGLETIILFGSCARGEIRPQSDVDLLVLTRGELEREMRGDIASSLDEAADGVSTDVKFYRSSVFHSSRCRFVREVKRDGIILWREKEDEA